MSDKKETKKRGAPLGNQNARKHGFYSRVLTAEQKRDFEQAVLAEGIDEEIAVLRVKIKDLLKYDPDNIKLIMQATTILARLISTKQKIRREDKMGLKEAITNVLKDIAVPLGIIRSTLDK